MIVLSRAACLPTFCLFFSVDRSLPLSIDTLLLAFRYASTLLSVHAFASYARYVNL